jgi:hypothetical protein
LNPASICGSCADIPNLHNQGGSLKKRKIRSTGCASNHKRHKNIVLSTVSTGRLDPNLRHTYRRTTGGHVKDPTVVLHQKETELARVRIEVEALQTVVPLLDDPMEQLPDLISRQDLATNSEDRSLADLEVYYPFGKNLRVAASSAKQG